MARTITFLLFIFPFFLFAQPPIKIIDIHVHSYTDADFGSREPATDHRVKGSKNAEVHMMFGSDQMVWPYAIEKSIRFLNSLAFLTKRDKEDILYNNAARFLRLKN